MNILQLCIKCCPKNTQSLTPLKLLKTSFGIMILAVCSRDKNRAYMAPLTLNKGHLTLIIRGGAKWHTANLNAYFSATGCPIDLKPSCIFKFVRCLEVYEKKWSIWTKEWPWSVFYWQGSPKISLAGSTLGSIWASMKVHEGSLNFGEVQQCP